MISMSKVQQSFLCYIIQKMCMDKNGFTIITVILRDFKPLANDFRRVSMYIVILCKLQYILVLFIYTVARATAQTSQLGCTVKWSSAMEIICLFWLKSLPCLLRYIPAGYDSSQDRRRSYYIQYETCFCERLT